MTEIRATARPSPGGWTRMSARLPACAPARVPTATGPVTGAPSRLDSAWALYSAGFALFWRDFWRYWLDLGGV